MLSVMTKLEYWFDIQAPVVQRVTGSIHFPLDESINFNNTYPLGRDLSSW